MFYTGLRDSDVIHLKRENLKQKDKIWYFDLREGKTAKDIIVPVHSSLFDNKVISDGDYIFDYPYERGNAVSRLGKLLKKILIRKKLNTDITFYCFRHTFRDMLERLEVDERIIERLMGKLPKSSIKHYSHMDLVGMKEAVEKLPKLNSFIFLSDFFQCFF